METNICDINHLDADVLLPPRKRLLAGYKKQSSDANGNGNYDSGSHQPMVASSSSPSSSSSSEFARLNNLVHNSNISNEEVAELAKSAAIAATKAAQDARAAAEEKAAIATKAIAAVKNALALVDSFNEEVLASKEKSLKKNKLKKHVPVQLLYKKHQTIEGSNTDEELARRLHRAMNSSPRISKNVSTSDMKGHKHKRPKSLSASEKIRVSNGGIVLGGNPACMSGGHAVIANVIYENNDSIREIYTVKVDEKESKYEKTRQLELENEEAEPSLTKEKSWEETSTPGKRRGRLKLKKLPLSMCTSRDRVNPKEERIVKATPLTDKNMSNPSAGRRMPLYALEPSEAVVPIEATPTWKCQEFKAPACVKQNKVLQS